MGVSGSIVANDRMSDKAQRCRTCQHEDGDPQCVHAWKWSDEIKTTFPAFRRRSCSRCPASECVLVCGPNDDRLCPCGKDDCDYCRQ